MRSLLLTLALLALSCTPPSLALPVPSDNSYNGNNGVAVAGGGGHIGVAAPGTPSNSTPNNGTSGTRTIPTVPANGGFLASLLAPPHVPAPATGGHIAAPPSLLALEPSTNSTHDDLLSGLLHSISALAMKNSTANGTSPSNGTNINLLASFLHAITNGTSSNHTQPTPFQFLASLNGTNLFSALNLTAPANGTSTSLLATLIRTFTNGTIPAGSAPINGTNGNLLAALLAAVSTNGTAPQPSSIGPLPHSHSLSDPNITEGHVFVSASTNQTSAS